MKVILTQTDTTVGFISRDEQRLKELKSRSSKKPFIKVFNTLSALKSANIRVPNKFKNHIRRSKKTTFIVKNQAFRVAKYPLNSQVLRGMRWHYSTSANQSGKDFCLSFCEQKADIIIEDRFGLSQNSSSSLYKINQTKRRKIR